MTRRILFWLHLCIGVGAGVAIFILSATGVLLAFGRQVLQLADRDQRTVNAPAEATARPLHEMLATVSASAGSVPSGVILRPDASASVEFTFGRDRNVYLDPYTGAVLGEGSRRAIAAASNLLLLLLVVSGLYLWLPRRWSWAAADLDRAAAVAAASLSGWRSMTLRVPAPGETAVVVSLDAGTGGQVEKRAELLVDTRSGQVLRVRRFADNELALHRLRRSRRVVEGPDPSAELQQEIAS
jgi:uncharacterized iron-regulated membrane protein